MLNESSGKRFVFCHALFGGVGKGESHGPFAGGRHTDIKMCGSYKPSEGHFWTFKFETRKLDLILGY